MSTTEIPTTATRPQDFAKKKRSGKLIELPSGAWVKAKGVDLTSFVKEGKIPNALLGIINDALKSGEEMSMESLQEDGDLDLDTIRDMYEMIDAIVMKIVLDPVIHPVPDNEADRSEELLYLDEFEDEDKLYLFNWSQGAVTDLESFRKEQRDGMASLQKGNGDQPTTESTDGPPLG